MAEDHQVRIARINAFQATIVALIGALAGIVTTVLVHRASLPTVPPNLAPPKTVTLGGAADNELKKMKAHLAEVTSKIDKVESEKKQLETETIPELEGKMSVLSKQLEAASSEKKQLENEVIPQLRKQIEKCPFTSQTCSNARNELREVL